MKKSKPKKKKVEKIKISLMQKKLNKALKSFYWGQVNEGKFFDLIEGNLTTNKEKI